MGTDWRKVTVLGVLLCALLALTVSMVFSRARERSVEPREQVRTQAALPAVPTLAWATLPMPKPPQPTASPAPVRVTRDPFTGGPGLTQAQRLQKLRKEEQERLNRLHRAEIEVRDIPGVHITEDTRSTRTRTTERTVEPPILRYCGYIVARDGQVLALVEDLTTGRGHSLRIGAKYAGLSVIAITPDSLRLEDRSGNIRTLQLTVASADQRYSLVEAQ